MTLPRPIYQDCSDPLSGFSTILEDNKRLRAVDLAVRGRRGERYGQDGTQRET